MHFSVIRFSDVTKFLHYMCAHAQKFNTKWYLQYSVLLSMHFLSFKHCIYQFWLHTRSQLHSPQPALGEGNVLHDGRQLHQLAESGVIYSPAMFMSASIITHLHAYGHSYYIQKCSSYETHS